MHRSLSIIIIILALLPIFLYVIYTPTVLVERPLAISQEDRSRLLEYSYHILYDYFDMEPDVQNDFPTISDSVVNYNILFITILNNGSVRGCQSGSTNTTQDHRIFLDIQEAIVESIEDDRFGGKLEAHEIQHCQIMFTFLYNLSWLYNKSLIFLQNNIELGVHAIELIHNNTQTIFKESVPISDNYDLEYTLERLCNKAGLAPDAYMNDDVDLFRYDTLTFMGKRNASTIELYRYSIFVNISDINQEMIYDSIRSGTQWYLNTINPETQRLEYLYYPSADLYSTDDNEVRQLASLWALTELWSFFHDANISFLIHTTLDYYTSLTKTYDNFSYVPIDGEAKLASNAFLILALLQTPEYSSRNELMQTYARGILSLQNENGSFNTYFFSDQNTGVDYYPGEAMLSLMKLYLETGNDAYLQSVKEGFSYYRDYWRTNKSTAFIPWHSQTYALLFEETTDVDIAEFIFEMNDWIIDTYQIHTSPYKDEIGGFPTYFPTFSTSVFLEGINDAYSLAFALNDSYHSEKYRAAIEIGTRFILQTQCTSENTFYLPNASKAIGGFKTSLTDNSIRIDNTQHAVLALMKVYKNAIFPNVN